MTLTYEIVEQLTGMFKAGLGQVFELIQRHCTASGLPPLSVLVVNKEQGQPGAGFHGSVDVAKAKEAVYSADWSRVRAPTPEDFARLK